MKKYLWGFLLFVIVLPISAEANDCWWYGAVGGGALEVYDLKISNTEQKILNTSGVTGTSAISNKSFYKEIMVGRCFNRYLSTELAYIWGVGASTDTTISNVNVGTVTINGIPVNIGNISGNVTANRQARVSASQLSLIAKLPVTDNVSLFVRGGLLHYQLDVTSKISFPNQYNIYIASDNGQDGDVLMGSVGADIRVPQISKRLFFRFEYMKTGAVRIVSGGIVFRFKE